MSMVSTSRECGSVSTSEFSTDKTILGQDERHGHTGLSEPDRHVIHRHLGTTDADVSEMLATLGLQSLGELSG